MSSVRPLTFVMSIPSPWIWFVASAGWDGVAVESPITMFRSVTLLVLSSTTASPPVFWIVPLEPGTAPTEVRPRVRSPALVMPTPVTVRPPLVPVDLSTMPFAAPLTETLSNVTPAAPIVVFVMVMPAPVVVIVLPGPVAVTVPPPVAVKAGFDPVSRVSVPVNAIVPAPLSVSRIPVPSEIGPLKVIVPADRFETATDRVVVVVMLPG